MKMCNTYDRMAYKEFSMAFDEEIVNGQDAGKQTKGEFDR